MKKKQEFSLFSANLINRVPHGWGRMVKKFPEIAKEKKGINVNLIIDDNWKNLESFAGMVLLDGIPVKIEKI